MGESKDYVSRSDELGNIHISEEVLAAISAAAALEVEGVSSLGSQGKKNPARAVHIKLEEEKVVVSMSVLMAYGHTIPEMGKAVQEAVKKRHRVHDRPGGLRRQRQCGRHRVPTKKSLEKNAP